MTISLYDAVAPSFLQTLQAVDRFLARGLEHCQAAHIDPESLVETRLISDMLPLRFQLISVAHHSATALEGVLQGAFSPPPDLGPLDYTALQGLIADAERRVSAVSPDAINAAADRGVDFRVGSQTLPFTGQDFLLSFSLPNFYFHTTTAYDILRHKGVPLGKRDFLGRLRMRKA
jgi:hypothetical protein